MIGPGNEKLAGTTSGAIYELNDQGYKLKFQAEDNSIISQIIPVDDGYWIALNNQFIKVDKQWSMISSFYSETSLIFNSDINTDLFNIREPLISSFQDEHNRLHYIAYDSTYHLDKRINNRRYYINGVIQPIASDLDLFARVPKTGILFTLSRGRDNNKSIVALDPNGNILAEQPMEIGFINGSYFDKDGTLWLLTDNGLVVVRLKKELFKKYLNNETTYLNEYFQTRGITQTNDSTLWVGGLGKLRQLNLKTKTDKIFDDQILNRDLQLIDKSIWLSQEGYKIFQLNSTTSDVVAYDYPEKDRWSEKKIVTPRDHWKIHKDMWGNLWAGSFKGISMIDVESHTLSHLENVGSMQSLEGAEVIDIHENNQGMWLATTKGVYLFDPVKRTILAHYHTEAKEGHRLPHNDIAHIYEDSEGVFWLASRGGGLIKWDPGSGNFEQFTTKDGLSHDVIYAVYEDHDQNLWLPSFFGINQFHKVNHNTSYYLKADGLTHNEFNTISHFRGHDSTLYFGGLNGVNAFHPKDFSASLGSELAPLVITGITKQNKTTGELKDAYAALEQDNQITLYPSEVGFNLSFRLLDYSLSKEALYAYKIQGLDANWNYQSISNLRLNRLPYGDYEFQIKASPGQGLWTGPTSFKLVVVRPIYLRTWFILACILLVTVVIYLLFYFRNRRLIKNQEKLKVEVALRTKEIEKQSHELKKLDSAKSQFFANVSHELRTPLTLILSPLRELINKGKFSDAQVNQLKRMYRNGHNLSVLVEEILELSKLEAGKLEIRESEVEVKPFLNRVVSAYESLATNRGIDFSCHLHFSDQTALYLDEGKLEKVVNNLISNALKFTDAQGFVKVSAFLEYDHLRILVEDSGHGISQKDLSKIFDRYYQGELKQQSQLQGGTGIGLALAKELTEAMGGTITVESKLKEGSAFQVVLPRKEVTNVQVLNGEPKSQNLSKAAQPIQSISNGEAEFTLLLVEDNTDMRNYIGEILAPQYDVLLAENGKRALEYLKTRSVDLVVSDVMMPEMDGFTLLKILKSNDLYHHLPIIMLTARAENNDKMSALTIGVDDYLTKPFMADELKARVKNLLINYKNRKQLTDQPQKVASEGLMSELHIQIDSNENLKWIKQVEQEALSRLNDFDFSMEVVAESLNITDRQLQRKVKHITGLTPNKYIQELRLQLGRSYLEKGAYKTVNEVTLAVGFKSSRYFSKLFRERFGKSTADYLKSHGVNS